MRHRIFGDRLRRHMRDLTDKIVAAIGRLERDRPRAWITDEDVALFVRAAEQARFLDHSWCGQEHLLLAILHPSSSTVASRVLRTVGVTHEQAASHFRERLTARLSTAHVTTNPAYHATIGMAQGLALATNKPLADEHVLLALIYSRRGKIGAFLNEVGVDVGVVLSLLNKGHVRVPALLPPPTRHVGPLEARVYFPAAEHRAVIDAMSRRFPPGTAYWGFNVSTWKPDHLWIDAERGCRAADIVAAVVDDPSAIDVVAIQRAQRYEAEAS